MVPTDAQRAALAPPVERCRPRGETPHRDLRRTIGAIAWRHRNGAEWRSIPAEAGPWRKAARTFIRRARLGVWGRPLGAARERGGVAPGMAFLDGTSVRARQRAAGAARRGASSGAGRG